MEGSIEKTVHSQDAQVHTVDHRTTHESPGFSDLWQQKRILAWCLLVFLLPVNFGFELALIGNIIATPVFLDRFVLNAATTVGTFVVVFAAGFIADKIGRRKVVLAGCLLCIVGIFVQGFANFIMMLIGGKLISTLGYGLGHALSHVYVAEIVPDNLRGICLTLVNTMIVVGQWSCALVGYGGLSINNDWVWRMPILSQLLPPILTVVLGMILLPESPSWLILHGQHEKAIAALHEFNGPNYDAAAVVVVLEAAVQRERTLQSESASYLECLKGVNLRRTLIVSKFVQGYLPYYFTHAEVENPVGIAQISYAIQLVGNIVSLFLVDRIGRRPMIVYGTIAITCLLLLVGGLRTLENNRTALQAVTPTARLRQKTYSINVMSNTAATCLVTQLVPILINPSNANLGVKVAFVFFAPPVPSSIYMYFCFPEMKGRSYLELETMFQRGSPARSFSNIKCEIEVATIAKDDDLEKPVAIVFDEDLSKV
ncbi:maltose permease [Alternaria alternata]|nr:maltose permease [Alternaria alternata]